MRKVPGLVVHDRMPQGKGVKGFKETKKVSGWSVEEMRKKPNIAVEVDTDEMRKWRDLSQSEMGLCWKNLAERMEESKKAKKRLSEAEVPFWNGKGWLKCIDTDVGCGHERVKASGEAAVATQRLRCSDFKSAHRFRFLSQNSNG